MLICFSFEHSFICINYVRINHAVHILCGFTSFLSVGVLL